MYVDNESGGALTSVTVVSTVNKRMNKTVTLTVMELIVTQRTIKDTEKKECKQQQSRHMTPATAKCCDELVRLSRIVGKDGICLSQFWCCLRNKQTLNVFSITT